MTKSIKKTFISNGVNNRVDLELQTLLWDMNELLKEKRKEKMDLIQWFDIFKVGNHLIVKNRQYNPIMKDKLIVKRKNLHLSSMTILIIEGITKQVMLLAEER